MNWMGVIFISQKYDTILDNTMVTVFKALGDETRLFLFRLIVHHPDICACELLKKTSIAQTTLSHHLKILAQADLVIARKEGRWKHYSANSETMNNILKHMQTLREEN